MNKCYLCGAGLKKEKVDIARYWGKQLIALNNVPVLVCSKCGERYFDAKTSSKIDERIKEVLNKKLLLRSISQ